MRPNPLKAKLNAGETVFGTFISMPDPGIVEAVGAAGFDYVLLDMEHSPIDFGALRILMSAADAVGLPSIVRVGTPDANPILRVLDTGAFGIMVPHIRTRDEAEAMVRGCRYPPEGIRGAQSASRANSYGRYDFLDHVRDSNKEVLTIALIEDPLESETVREIVSVPGLDVVFPGPGDLAAALGVPGQMQHPTVLEYVQRVVDGVNDRQDCVLGYQIMQPSQMARCRELGARFIIYSQDSRVIYNAYRTALDAIRQ